MIFILGVIVGLVVGVALPVIALVLFIYFRHPTEQKLVALEKRIGLAGPRPKGSVFFPPEESIEKRDEIIEENRKKGLDTPIEDLR